MSGSSEDQVTVKGKRTRKAERHLKEEVPFKGKEEFQKQGMSEAWQGFYVRVQEAMDE